MLLGRCSLLDRRGELAAAEQACHSARRVFEEVGEEGGVVEADLTLARLARLAGRFAEARSGLLQGARRAAALADADLQELARKELAELDLDEGRKRP